MDVSPYTNYVRSMVEHGERRLTEINWLFEAVEKSLSSAERNFLAKKKSSAYISLRHAKNLTGFQEVVRQYSRSKTYQTPRRVLCLCRALYRDFIEADIRRPC